jgi:hypothetical protein
MRRNLEKFPNPDQIAGDDILSVGQKVSAVAKKDRKKRTHHRKTGSHGCTLASMGRTQGGQRPFHCIFGREHRSTASFVCSAVQGGRGASNKNAVPVTRKEQTSVGVLPLLDKKQASLAIDFA